MNRRSVWDDGPKEASWGGTSSLPSPMTVMEQIPAAKARRKTDRREREPVVTFRGVPPDLHDQVKKIAATLDVPVGEVARFLFEFSLAALERGDLRLNPVLAQGRRTLFPPKGWGASRYTPAVNPPKRKRRNGNAPKVSYRGIPPETAQQIVRFAELSVIPVGELARRLLEFGIEAYQSGKLAAETYAVVTKNTLYG